METINEYPKAFDFMFVPLTDFFTRLADSVVDKDCFEQCFGSVGTRANSMVSLKYSTLFEPQEMFNTKNKFLLLKKSALKKFLTLELKLGVRFKLKFRVRFRVRLRVRLRVRFRVRFRVMLRVRFRVRLSVRSLRVLLGRMF